MMRAQNLQSMLACSFMLTMLAGCGTTSVTVIAPGYLEAYPQAVVPVDAAREWCGGLGIGLQMVKGKPYFTGALEFSLPGLESSRQSIVIAGGLGRSALKDRIADGDPYDGDDTCKAETGDYSESLSVTWRRYLKQPMLDGASVFWEVGTSCGSVITDLRSEDVPLPYTGGTYKEWSGEFVDAMRLVFGVGAKWIGAYGYTIELAADAQATPNGIDTAFNFLIGGSFGRAPRAPRAGRWAAESSGPRMGMVIATGEAAHQLEALGLGPVLSVLGWQLESQHQGRSTGPRAWSSSFRSWRGWSRSYRSPRSTSCSASATSPTSSSPPAPTSPVRAWASRWRRERPSAPAGWPCPSTSATRARGRARASRSRLGGTCRRLRTERRDRASRAARLVATGRAANPIAGRPRRSRPPPGTSRAPGGA